DTPPEQHGNGVEQTLFVHAVAVGVGQLHRDTQCTAARNDGYLVHRIGLGQAARNQRVAGLVVGRIAALFFGHDERAALGTHDDLVFRFFEVVHFNRATTASRGE